MVLEPELEYERIEFVSLIFWWSIIMILAIIVSESHEDRGIWKVLCEQFLNNSVGFL